MSGFRALLLWLVMLAVPFQAYAAASMGLCATQSPDRAAAAATGHAASHDHAAHAPSAQVHQAHDAATSIHDHDHDGTHDAPADADSFHKCGACSACHVAALTDTQRPVALSALPQADLAEPPHAMATLAPRVLDKPPRA